MKISFQFNPKSNGLNVPMALSIAENCEMIIENDVCKIDFNSPKDRNLE